MIDVRNVSALFGAEIDMIAGRVITRDHPDVDLLPMLHLYEYSERYRQGNAGRKDVSLALRCCRQAADLGSTEAMWSLSKNYNLPEGEARRYLENAARYGHPDAQYEMYCLDRIRYRHYFERAVRVKHPPALRERLHELEEEIERATTDETDAGSVQRLTELLERRARIQADTNPVEFAPQRGDLSRHDEQLKMESEYRQMRRSCPDPKVTDAFALARIQSAADQGVIQAQIDYVFYCVKFREKPPDQLYRQLKKYIKLAEYGTDPVIFYLHGLLLASRKYQKAQKCWKRVTLAQVREFQEFQEKWKWECANFLLLRANASADDAEEIKAMQMLGLIVLKQKNAEFYDPLFGKLLLKRSFLHPMNCFPPEMLDALLSFLRLVFGDPILRDRKLGKEIVMRAIRVLRGGEAGRILESLREILEQEFEDGPELYQRLLTLEE
jgi:hypothetical protein